MRHRCHESTSTPLLLLALLSRVAAKARFSNVFQSHMVLQRGQPIRVWGFDAAPQEALSVSLAKGVTSVSPLVKTRANSEGDWAVVLDEPAASITGLPLSLALYRGDSTVKRREAASTQTNSSENSSGLDSALLQQIDDVVLGDVYLFTGQSNVDIPVAYAWQLDPKAQEEEERLGDHFGKLGLVRLMTIPTRCGMNYQNAEIAEELLEMEDCLPCPSPFAKVQEPVNRCNALGGKHWGPYHYSYCGCDALRWSRATGPMLRGFSAVAWFTGRWLAQWPDLGGVPIGLIRSSWGASSIASWSSKEAVAACPQSGQPVHTFAPHFQSTLYSHMIAPLEGLHLKAVVWVHGARNVGDETPYMGATYYTCALQAMIKDVRSKFNQTSLPFLVVEMPAYCNSEDFQTWHTWCTERHSKLQKADQHLAEMRLAQLEAEKLGGVYVVSTMDQGTLAHSLGGTIHSMRKCDLGKRLSLAARAGIYNDSQAVWSGPALHKAWRPHPGWVGLCFNVPGGGALLLDSSKQCPVAVLPVYCTGAGFEVKVNGVWMPPFSATVNGSAVMLEVPAAGVAERVRYAWADWPVTALTSEAGQPARTFNVAVGDGSNLQCAQPLQPKVAVPDPASSAAKTSLGSQLVTGGTTGSSMVDEFVEDHPGILWALVLANVLCCGLAVIACCKKRASEDMVLCRSGCELDTDLRTMALSVDDCSSGPTVAIMASTEKTKDGKLYNQVLNGAW